MRRIGMRLLALCCCLFLTAGLLTAAAAAPTENCSGSCSHEAAIGTTHYDTLAEALTAATDGITVTVLKDIPAADAMTVNSAITLDLGGKTVTGQNSDSEGLLNVQKDITVKNGTLTTSAGTALLATNCVVTLDKTATLKGTDEAAALLLYGDNQQAAASISGKMTNEDSLPAFGIVSFGTGSCDISIGSTAEISSADSTAIEMHGAGKLNITGGTITAKENVIVMDVSADMTMEASITGGKFQVTDGETILITKDTNATAPEDFVIGGSFNKVPTDYVPTYCRTDDNGNGTYTVTAEYTVSYGANGGSGTMASTKADRGTTITLPRCTYTAPAGKHFKAWQIGGKEYAPGASFAMNGNVTMTALWADHYGGTATCTSKAVCSGCGAAYGAVGTHKLVSSSGYAATCTSYGMNSHTKCSTCGGYFVSGISISQSSLTIPALGHDMRSVEGKDATCTEEGLLAHEKCATCGLLQAKGEPITEEALILSVVGHDLQKVDAVASTCTEAGIAAHEKCTLCQGIFVNGKEVSADTLTTEVNSHVLSDWESDETSHWKTCVDCGEVFRQHSHKDADANEACDECNYPMAVSQEVPAEEESGFSFPFLIPIIAAVVIAVIAVVIAVKKKSR